MLRRMNPQAVWKLNLPQCRTRMSHLPAHSLTGLAPQGARPANGVRRFRTRQIKRRREPRVMRVALYFVRYFGTRRESRPLKLNLQLIDAARQRIHFTLFTPQLRFDPLEPCRQPLVTLVLCVNNPLLFGTQDALEVGELLD